MTSTSTSTSTSAAGTGPATDPGPATGRLAGRTALVTGATSGIGLATAHRFAREGATVVVTGRRQQQLDAAVAAIGPRAVGVRGDAGDLADIERVMATIGELGGGLDVLFANAGGGEFGTLGEISWDTYRTTFDRNVGGTLFTVQAALPLLADGASVILAGSTAATRGSASFGVYGASKAAVRSFARTWAAELAPRRIRVNVLVPGPVDTPGLGDLAPDPAAARRLLQQLADGVPLKRLGHPDEIADAALFLAADSSRYVTGSELVVDGGTTQL